ncbi:MAG: DUF4837 family protein [Bacteroidales bacterium]
MNQKKKQRRLSSFTILMIAVLGFTACTTVERPSKPSASGRAGELLAVMEPRLWDGEVGETFRQVFRAEVPMLPQREPMFDVIHIPSDDFTKVFEPHRHIFRIELDQTLESPTIEITRDVYSYPQLVVTVKGPNPAEISRILNDNKEGFHDRYLQLEYIRLQNAYRRMIQSNSYNAVKETFGLEMIVPEGYYPVIENEDFIWLRKSATNEDFDQAVMIWSMDYTDPEVDFDEDVIWNRRDSITERYIPGHIPDTYMATYRGDPLELRPAFREVSLNGKFAMEMRGLWRVEGDFMGGPFVTYTFVDEENSRLLMVDGWVFAPKYEKRDYMRQVEAIIWSARFADPEEDKEEAPEGIEPPAEELPEED